MRRRLTAWMMVGALVASCGTTSDANSVPSSMDPAMAPTSIAPPAAASTSVVVSAPATDSPSTTDANRGELAWTEVEAERDVANYLAALAAGRYDVAAWSMENNGIVFDGHPRESPTDTLSRLCDGGSCLGPYTVQADGPGVVDPQSMQASSTVTVTHADSGLDSTVQVSTFEGSRVVSGIPPLVPTDPSPGLVEQLFDGAPPPNVVIQRFEAFEIWGSGGVDWVVNWAAEETSWVEGDSVFAGSTVFGLTDPQRQWHDVCGPPLVADDQVVGRACEVGEDGAWGLVAVETGERVAGPIPYEEMSDGEYQWFDQRGGVTLIGTGDVEGNLTRIATLDGVDLLGDDHAGYSVLSTDGEHFAYTEHHDPAAYSHFWSPVVVVRSTTDGSEIGRWVLDSAVIGLEMSGDWLVAWLADDETLIDSPVQAAVAAIDLETGRVNVVPARTKVFLPTVLPVD